jgi:acetylornithine deacetylase/succinyl-diaminopimelate desuccinylase-like protein
MHRIPFAGWFTSAAIALLWVLPSVMPPPASAQALTPHQAMLREIYEEMIEIDTTDSVGDNTRAAEAVAQRLRAAGFPAADVQVIVPAGNARKGNLVARLRGTGLARPLLLLGHLDVVEAKREDWERDPLTLVEENGYFFARGAADDKAMSSVLAANLIRLKQEGFVPNRDLILALTADEERGGDSEFNGVELLLKQHRPLIDAELALNEGGGGQLTADGRPLFLSVQHAEKTYQNFRLEATNPGGHSSLPRRDNAIYSLAEALSRISRYQFPVRLSDLTRRYFERLAAIEPGAGADIRTLLDNPGDATALRRLSAEPRFNVQFRTTCVTTMMEAGHAENALPQRARAVVNCRILPEERPEDVQRTLREVVADPAISITPTGNTLPSPASPHRGDLMRAVEAIAEDMWPGVPVLPTMSAGGTDGRFLRVAGIPTYGVSGLFADQDGTNSHGLNERIRVRSLYESQEFLYRLVKALSGTAD